MSEPAEQQQQQQEEQFEQQQEDQQEERGQKGEKGQGKREKTSPPNLTAAATREKRERKCAQLMGCWLEGWKEMEAFIQSYFVTLHFTPSGKSTEVYKPPETEVREFSIKPVSHELSIPGALRDSLGLVRLACPHQ